MSFAGCSLNKNPFEDKVICIDPGHGGTAGIDSMLEVRKVTDNFVLIDGGELGTTCARVGCMPSKVMIQVADDFHRLDPLIPFIA